MRASISGSPSCLGRVRVQVAAAGRACSRRLSRDDAGGVAEVQHGVLAGAELHALVLRRQEAAAPQAGVERLVDLARRDEHDERRQVLVVAAEAVVQPRAHARPAGDLRAGLEERDRRVVVDRLGVHRADEAEVVDDLGGVRQQLADPRAACAVLREFEERAGQRQRRLVARHAGEPLALAHGVGQLLAVPLVEQRLVVEHLQLRRPAGHEQVDDALRLGGEVQLPAEHAAVLARQRRRRTASTGSPGSRARCRRGPGRSGSGRRGATGRPPAARPTHFWQLMNGSSSHHHELVEVHDRARPPWSSRRGRRRPASRRRGDSPTASSLRRVVCVAREQGALFGEQLREDPRLRASSGARPVSARNASRLRAAASRGIPPQQALAPARARPRRTADRSAAPAPAAASP